MTTTTKNRDYYLDVLTTPRYLLRDRLTKDYQHLTEYGINTLDMVTMVADHLTAYADLTSNN